MMINVARLAFALALATAGVGVLVTGLAAQSASTSVQSSVTVAPPPILFENLRNLEFGSVTLGQVVTVTAVGPHAPGTLSAGARFTNLRKQDNYNLRFGLPAQLLRGGSSIPVTWSGLQYGSLCVWRTVATSCDVMQVAFSPQAHTTAPLLIDLPSNSPGNNFSGDVFLGGQLNVPSSGVVPGVYTGTITIYLTAVS